ncbi:MAG: TldD/PmbA family protein [Methanospirillum sp.]|uniref:TldD/PmbA family protein n=1 Tax=Methanospirillum sp. TaxID=45200 RepID=UPI0023724F11|nr:TldD/PmbA family protein [Methanospirillum sp.]MDD1729912.1 TldD/PmbA family protein [Methanospirillum sp.]
MQAEPRYYDIRRVRGEITQIDIDNGKVEQAGTSFYDKATIRALGKAGWGVLSVSGDQIGSEHLNRSLLSQAMNASVITNERVEIAEVPSKIHQIPKIGEDPRNIGIEEKVAILLDLEKEAAGEHITSRRVTYTEKAEEIFVTDSSGNEYQYELCRCGFSVLAVASRSGIVQMGYERDHTIKGLNIRHRQNVAREAAERAVSLLDAKPAKGGKMHAILDPELGGVFAHEAVGHAAEGDLVREGNSVLKGKIGSVIGSSSITIVDDPSLVEFGFCPIDDEGSATSRTEIIRNGIMNSYLHSKETLARVGDGVPGHCRGMAGEIPIVRMSNTFIENGDASFEEILESCRNGILLKGSRGGQVDPGRGMFQFNAEYGYLVEGGECTAMVRDVSLAGEILSTLHSVELVAKDRALHPGYCGKGGQTVPVTDGAPHLLLRDAIVGGCDVC